MLAPKSAYASFFLATFFALAGLDLPNDPLNVFPFLVFLSPLPMMNYFIERRYSICVYAKIKKSSGTQIDLSSGTFRCDASNS